MPEKHHVKVTKLLKKVAVPLKALESLRKGGKIVRMAEILQEAEELVKKMNDPGKKSEAWKNIGYSQKKEDEPPRVGDLLETKEPIVNSGKYLKMVKNQIENIDEPQSSFKELLKEADIPKKKAGQPLRNTGETLKRLSKLIKKKNESWSVADESTKLTEVQRAPGQQKETDEPFKKKEPQKNINEFLYLAQNLVQKAWKSMRKAEELVKSAGDPSEWVTRLQKESLENNGNPQNNANKSVNKAAKPLQKVSRPLMKAEECPKNATCTLKNGVKSMKKAGNSLMKAAELKEKALVSHNSVHSLKKNIFCEPLMKAVNSEEMAVESLKKACLPLKPDDLFQEAVDPQNMKIADIRKAGSNEVHGEQYEKEEQAQKIELRKKVKEIVNPMKKADKPQMIIEVIKIVIELLNKAVHLLTAATETQKTRKLKSDVGMPPKKVVPQKLIEPLNVNRFLDDLDKPLKKELKLQNKTQKSPMESEKPVMTNDELLKKRKPLLNSDLTLKEGEEFKTMADFVKLGGPLIIVRKQLLQSEGLIGKARESIKKALEPLTKAEEPIKVGFTLKKGAQLKGEELLIHKGREPQDRIEEPLKKIELINKVRESLMNTRESWNQPEKQSKNAGESLKKIEELLKKAEETLKKGVKKIGSTDVLKEIKSISKPRKPINKPKEPIKKVPMLERNIREPLKKMEIPVSKYENPQKKEYEPLKKGEKHRKKAEELSKEEESPNKKRKYMRKVTVSLKKVQETESFKRDVVEEPQSTEKSLEKEDVSLGMSVQSLKLEEPVKKEAESLMKAFEPLRRLREPLKKVDTWNSEDVLGDCPRTTPNFFRKTQNKIVKDECITKDRLVVKQSALCEKGEEEFELDKSSLKAYNLFCKCNPWKKSRKFQRKAHKLHLKVLEMEQVKCSELEVGKWEEIILQHSKEKDALVKKLVKLYKKSSNAEKELEEILKQVFEKQTEEKMIWLAKEVRIEKALQVKNCIYEMFKKISIKDFAWTKALREELYCLEKWYSDLLICINLLYVALKAWKTEIEELQERLIKSQVRKLMVEKERSIAYRKMTYLSREIAKLKLRTYMALSPDKFQMEVNRLRKRAAYYDYIAKFFQKQQIILQSKVFNLGDSHPVKKEDSVSLQDLFSWKKKNISKNADQYETADKQKNSSYQFKTPMESWTVSPRRRVRRKNCKTSPMVWNIESFNESATLQKTWNYNQLKSWRVTTNALYGMSTALPKQLSSNPNGISVQPLKMSSTAE